jgi:hypothetical protein
MKTSRLTISHISVTVTRESTQRCCKTRNDDRLERLSLPGRGEKTLSILHDWGRVRGLAQLLLRASPWIYLDSYIV